MVKYANYHIFRFMNINQNLKNKWKIIKKNVINKLILASNHHQTTIVAFFFISSVIQSDHVFYLMVLYENDLICIFMNINEYLKRRVKSLVKLVPNGVIRPILNH